MILCSYKTHHHKMWVDKDNTWRKGEFNFVLDSNYVCSSPSTLNWIKISLFELN
jgi:hypothetical protein